MGKKVWVRQYTLEQKIQQHVKAFRSALANCRCERDGRIRKDQLRKMLDHFNFHLADEPIEELLASDNSEFVKLSLVNTLGHRACADALHPMGPADTGLHTPGVLGEHTPRKHRERKGTIPLLANYVPWNNLWRQSLVTPDTGASFADTGPSASETLVGGLLDGHYYVEQGNPHHARRPNTAACTIRPSIHPNDGHPCRQWDQDKDRPLLASLLKGDYYGEKTPVKVVHGKKDARDKIRNNILRVRTKRQPKANPTQDHFPPRPSTSAGFSTARSELTSSRGAVSVDTESHTEPPPPPPKIHGPIKLHPLLTKKLQESWGQVNKAFKFLDQDRSQTIDLDEFEQLFMRFNIELTDEELEEAFRTFDLSNNGVITYQDFNTVVASVIHTVDEGGVGLQMTEGKEETIRQFDTIPDLAPGVPWNNKWRQETCQPDYGKQTKSEIPLIAGILQNDFCNQTSSYVAPAHKPPPPSNKDVNIYKQEWAADVGKFLMDGVMEGCYYGNEQEQGRAARAKPRKCTYIVARNRLKAGHTVPRSATSAFHENAQGWGCSVCGRHSRSTVSASDTPCRACTPESTGTHGSTRGLEGMRPPTAQSTPAPSRKPTSLPASAPGSQGHRTPDTGYKGPQAAAARAASSGRGASPAPSGSGDAGGADGRAAIVRSASPWGRPRNRARHESLTADDLLSQVSQWQGDSTKTVPSTPPPPGSASKKQRGGPSGRPDSVPRVSKPQMHMMLAKMRDQRLGSSQDEAPRFMHPTTIATPLNSRPSTSCGSVTGPPLSRH